MNDIKKLEKGRIEKDNGLAVPLFEMQDVDERPFGWKLIEQVLDPRTIKTLLTLCYWKDALGKSHGTNLIQTVRI